MAPQTRTQRQAAAKKAAATRKRNSARQSSGTAKASVLLTIYVSRQGASEAAGYGSSGSVSAWTKSIPP